MSPTTLENRGQNRSAQEGRLRGLVLRREGSRVKIALFDVSEARQQ